MPNGNLVRLSPEEARSVVLAAQLASGWSEPLDILRAQGIVQLDALTRIDKAHRLFCYARLTEELGGIDVDRGLWSDGEAVSFETYTHAACLVPIEDWPLFRIVREQRAAAAADRVPVEVRREVLRIVAESDGGAVIGDIESGTAKTAGWDWSDRKTALEQLVWSGEIVVTSRRGVKRVYDLPERRIPRSILTVRLERDALNVTRANRALAALGIVTVSDLMRHYHIPETDARDGLANSDGIAVTVADWETEAWMDPSADQSLRFEVTSPGLIGPFDNLLRDRARARRLFGFDYVFEAYVPAAKRKYGHYAMALVHQNDFIGRIDAQRVGRMLQIQQTFPEPGVDAELFSARVESASQRLARHLALEIAFDSRL